MTPIDAYERYMAIKCHWDETDYDFFLYNGKVKITHTSFNRRKDKRIFMAACRTMNLEDWTDLLVISIVDFNNKLPFVGDLLDGDRIARGQEWQRRRKDPLSAFQKDVELMKVRFAGSIEELVRSKYPAPPILSFYWQKLIWPDTLVHMNRILKFRKKYDKELKHHPLWSDVSNHIYKLSKFVPKIPTSMAENVLFSAFPLPFANAL